MTPLQGQRGSATRLPGCAEGRGRWHRALRSPMLLTGLAIGLASAGCGVAPQARVPVAAPASACQWQWLEAGPLRVRVEDCRHATGHWRVRHDPDLPGLALWRDGERVQTVLHWLRKPESADVRAVMATLQAGGHVPPGEDCVFREVPGPVQPAGTRRHEIRPAGERLKAFEATPRDQVPDPPCGAYGWSTHGVRYFLTDARQPGWVLFVDIGQDGTQVDPASISWR